MRATSFCLFAGLLAVAGSFNAPLGAATETELKDDAGKTIIRYVVEAPERIAPAGRHRSGEAGGLVPVLSGARPADRR